MAEQPPDPRKGQGLEKLNSFASDRGTSDLFATPAPSVQLDLSDLDDNISVTSTVYPDESEDFEYEVEDILAEEVDFDGVLKYLVRWKSYPLEMCTWEPTENFTPELLEDIWEQKKRRPDFQPFDRSLLDEAQRAKALRHISRNRKRRRLGLAETSPIMEAAVLARDSEISDIELICAEASSTVIMQGTPAASPVLATTEIIDSDDDLMVIEDKSAPPQEKKKKRPVAANDDDPAMPLKKKKKAKNIRDSAEQAKTDKEKKERKERKEGKEKKEESKEKRKEKRDRVEEAEKEDGERPRNKVEDKTKSKSKVKNKGKDKPEKLTGKPVPAGEPQKEKTPAEAVPMSKDKAKGVTVSPKLQKNTPHSATPSIRSSGSVSDREPACRAPAKRASIDHAAKPAAPATTASAPKAKPAARQNGNAPLPDKVAERPTKHTTNPSGSASVSTPTTARPAKDLPSLKEAGPSTSSIPTTAKKTTTTGAAKQASTASPDAGGNAFSAGKRTLSGRSFAAAMTDPNNTPQLFGNRSTLRRAELLERDKPDRAIEPSQLKIGLFPITSGPPVNANANLNSTTTTTSIPINPDIAIHGTQQSSEALPLIKPVAHEFPLRPSLKRAESSNTFRKRKSVRFSDNDGSDAGLLLGRTRLKSPPVPQSESTDGLDADEDVPMDFDPQKTQKIVTPASITLPPVPVNLLFGTQKNPVHAMLDVQAESGGSQQLLDRIITGKTLRFDCSFLAATLMQQVRGIAKENVFSGNVRVPSETQESSRTTEPSLSTAKVLQTAAQRLKLMSSGLILVQSEHVMVVYPTQCEEWPESMFGFPAPLEVDATVALRYVVLSTNVDCEELLRPIECPGTNYDWLSGDQDRQQVMGRFHNLSRQSFLDLLPDGQAKKEERIIFLLAFPPTLKPFMWQIALWLREMHAGCEVRFSTQPGAWMSFMREVEQENHAGVVIVHELAIDAVRRFPYFRRLVAPGRWNARIWSISQGTYASPIFYPMVAPACDKADSTRSTAEILPIGRISWTELFPRGLALLLTPSVILADPMLVYHLLRWVSAAARSGKAPVTLVAAHDFCDEIKQVADEKLELLTEMINESKSSCSRGNVWREAKRIGAAESHCVYRHESWALANELCDSGTQKLLSSMRGADWPDAVVFADPCIDANDEQSLVNWFGWWSTLYMDQYRSFYVIGSEYKGPHLDIMSRKVRIPDFVNMTLDNAKTPTATAALVISETSVQKPAPPVARPLHAKLRKAHADPPTQPAANDPRRATRTNSTSSAASMPSTFRHPTQPLTMWSDRLLSMNNTTNFWKIFGFIVWWRDAEEAYKYGQLNSGNHTIRDWMNFTWRFSVAHRSYVGLFNLADGPQEANTPTSNEQGMSSHPWVVVWRPVNPHRQEANRDETELIFWDPWAMGRVKGRDKLTESEDLTSGQRAVVDFIRRHGSEKNPGTYLSKVWLCTRAQTWKPATARDDEGAMQACLKHLEKLAGDFKFVMPPMSHYLMQMGYQPVMTGNSESGTESTSARVAGTATTAATAATAAAEPAEPAVRHPPTAPASMRNGLDSGKIDTSKEKKGPPAVRERLVFHPPRGTSATTRCRNVLHESALLARKCDPDATTMHFKFRPTVEWYREQDEEGSGFEHVHVETVSEVCKIFGIPMTKGD